MFNKDNKIWGRAKELQMTNKLFIIRHQIEFQWLLLNTRIKVKSK